MQLDLKHSIVHRGGVTANHLVFETRSVRCHVNGDGSFHLVTTIDSKGGGQTVVRIHVGEVDVASIVAAIAALGPQGVRRLSDGIVAGTTAARDAVATHVGKIDVQLEKPSAEAARLEAEADEEYLSAPYGSREERRAQSRLKKAAAHAAQIDQARWLASQLRDSLLDS